MSYTTAVLLGAAAVVIIVAVLVEVNKYFRGRSIISRRQLILRVVMGGLILLILGLSFYGLAFLPQSAEPLTELIFWLVVLVIAVVVVILALADLRRVRATQHRARAELYQRLVDLRQEIADLTEARQAEEQPEQDSESES